MQFTARDVICASVYGHWPEAEVILELSMAFAKQDNRSQDDALRACAAKLAYRIKDKKLQGLLLSMVIHDYPSNVLLTIKQKTADMVKNLRKEGGELFEYPSYEALKASLKRPL